MDDRATYAFVEPGLWPSANQELLLRAALLGGDTALAAWHQWRLTIDSDLNLEPGTFRLLPLLYDTLKTQGVRDPLLQRFKGVFRRSWVESQQILDYMRPLLLALHDQGFQTLLLKGVPLAYCYYRRPATRPMSDFDVLVPTAEAPAAIDFLQSIGWTICSSRPAEDLHYRHSISFRNDADQEVDLHWHAMHEWCHRDIDNSFWERSVPFNACGIRTRRPDTTHNLLHATIHGIRWNIEPPIRWIADAVTILKADAAAVDWEYVVNFANDNKITYRVALGLRYLQERMDAQIPKRVMECLMSAPPTFVERLESITVLKAPASGNFRVKRSIRGLLGRISNYCRYAACQPRSERRNLLQYLVYSLRLNKPRELGSVVLKHVRRWIRPPSLIERQ